ncbi:MAG: hypothetical protein QGI43_04740 [Gemmatimonadota bacterium]|nr:hypothetical protein [Gemmatimonadota bacterium]
MDSDENMQKALEPVILFRVDAEKGEGVDLAARYGVSGFPTFVLMNAEGAAIDVWAGYGDADGFTERLASATADLATIDEKRVRFGENPTGAGAVSLARIEESQGKYEAAIALYLKAIEMESREDVKREDDILRCRIYHLMENGEGTQEEIAAAADAVVASEKATPTDLLRVSSIIRWAEGVLGDEDFATPYIKAAVEGAEGSEDESVAQQVLALRPDYELRVNGDAEAALRHKRVLLEEGWRDDARELNSFAWWCFENGVNLEEAEELATRGVELSSEGSARGHILDTLAEIQNARGRPVEALATMRVARKEDPENEHYKGQETRFAELAGETD